jgi:hypothetical protein
MMVSTMSKLSGAARLDHIVPFAMKFIRMEIHLFHLLCGDLASRGILAAVQSADHAQSFGSCGLGDEIHHGFIVP